LPGFHSTLVDNISRREYWILPEEKSMTLYCFAEAGDSGATVITNDGAAVGMIWGSYHPGWDEVSIVVNAKGILGRFLTIDKRMGVWI
jgi:hypothetical protein